MEEPYCYELAPEDCVLRQRVDATSKPIRKRIIICCDGTWQSAVSGKKNVPSNVTRLCRALNGFGTDEEGHQWQQVVWYDSGVGTTALAIGDAVEGATGVGLEGNVIEAYNFCVLNFNPGDKIYCFGFSRGAYTARTIAGLISDIGVCHKRDLNKFSDLWKVYKDFKEDKTTGDRFHRSEAWYQWMWGKLDEKQGAAKGPLVWTQRPQGDWAQDGSREVEVVGVYDTVGALGMPEVMGVQLPSILFAKHHGDWHNVGLSANIKHAFQALALDENRKAFEPVLFYIPKETASDAQLKDDKKAEKDAENDYWTCLEKVERMKAEGNSTDDLVNAAAEKANKAAQKWNSTARERVVCQNRNEMNSELKQVWFPGYHINIGGGSSDTLNNDGDMEEMSNIVFAWMLDQIKPHLSIDERFILEAYRKREKKYVELNNAYNAWTTSEKKRKAETWTDWTWRNASGAATALIHPFTSNEKSTSPEKPTYEGLRNYGWGVGEMKDSFTKMYWANGHHVRTPGQYALKKIGNKWVSLGDTCEYIHPVVNYRAMQTKKMHDEKAKFPNDKQIVPYKPIGSNYLRRKKYDKHTNRRFFEYEIGGCPKPIEEWQLGGLDSYERLAILGEPAYNYMDELDEALHSKVRTHRRVVLPSVDPPVKRPENKDEQKKKNEQETKFDCEFQPSTVLPKLRSTMNVTRVEESRFESHVDRSVSVR